jgi:hypothetical protein
MVRRRAAHEVATTSSIVCTSLGSIPQSLGEPRTCSLRSSSATLRIQRIVGHCTNTKRMNVGSGQMSMCASIRRATGFGSNGPAEKSKTVGSPKNERPPRCAAPVLVQPRLQVHALQNL